MIAAEAADNVLRIDRHFAAPRPFVFALWADPALLRTWWGPAGMRLAACEIDFRPGGRWRYHMTAPGVSHWTTGVYHEILPGERLVFSYDFNDLDVHSVVSVRFAEAGAGTGMQFCQTGFPNAAERQGHGGGWGSTFQILEEVLLRLHGIGSVFPDLPPARRDGVARDLEAARQRFYEDLAASRGKE
jgi:uncharacterized protein YndB with AHSA1/START domain